jgi:hypothetical protein
MSATVHNSHDLKDSQDESAAVGIAYGFGGFVVGALCTGLSLLAIGMAIAFAQGITGSDVCADGFSTAVTAGLFVFGIAISLFVGRTLFRWRRFIGAKGGNAKDVEFAAMLRKRFVYSSMATYCLLAPFSWLFMLAAANCAAK